MLETESRQGEDIFSLPLNAALKRRLAWSVTIGVLWVLSSLPVPAGPGREGISFDWISALLGIVLILEAILVRVRPHRVLFLIDGIWWGAVGAKVGYRVLTGGSSLWVLLVVGSAFFSMAGFRLYKHFGPEDSGTGVLRL